MKPLPAYQSFVLTTSTTTVTIHRHYQASTRPSETPAFCVSTIINICRRLRVESLKFCSPPVTLRLQQKTKELEAGRTRAEHLVKQNTDPTNTLSVIPALWNDVSLSTASGEMARKCPNGNHPDNKRQTTNFLFLAVTAQPPTSRQKSPSATWYSEEPPPSANTSITLICSNSTYKLRLSYGVHAASMRTVTILLYTGDGINLVSLLDASSPTMQQPHQTRKDA